MNRNARIAFALIAVVGWAALLTQLCIVILYPTPENPEIGARVMRFVSFFTVWGNTAVTVASTFIAINSENRLGRFFGLDATLAAVATYIAIVAVIYSLLLRKPWDPTTIRGLLDTTFHDLIPAAYVLCWLISAPKARLRWLDPIYWLVFPGLFITYTLIRGAVIGWYPYYFANVTLLGYPTALRNTGFVLLTFVIVGMVFVLAGKLIVHRTGATQN
ncbi:MAG: Pr6Pr family membrane protein [Pyrinomonadaceae bacterium]